MKELEYTEEIFLRFHVKKGTEFNANGNVVAIRSKTFNNVQETNKPIIITAGEEEGFMLLRPEDMRTKIDGISPIIKDKGYYLMFYKWLPIPRNKLELLDALYVFKKQFDARIENLLND